MNTIGSRIRYLRKFLKMSQAEFAEKLGMNHAIVSVWELDKIDIGEKTLKAICYTFGVNENWLRTGEGEIFLRKSYLNDELVSLLNQLSPQGQSTALAIIRTLVEQERINKGLEPAQETHETRETPGIGPRLEDGQAG